MRTLATVIVVLLMSGCSTQEASRGPPINQLYYPTGIVHTDWPGSTEGALFVANSNFDKRFSSGSVVGFTLDGLGLPAFGTHEEAGAPQTLISLNVQSQAVALISSFAGEMARLATQDNALRLFVPSRSEGNHFHAIQVTVGSDGHPVLECVDSRASNRDCTSEAQSLTRFQYDADALPRAPAPYGVAVRARACASDFDCGGRVCTAGVCRSTDGDIYGDVWVTHLAQADTPLGSGMNGRSYLVHIDSDHPKVSESSFVSIGFGTSNSVALGRRWAYASGRYYSSTSSVDLIRLIERRRTQLDNGETRVTDTVLSTGLEAHYRVADARGLVLSPDESQLYLIGRGPDVLIVISIDDADDNEPSLRVVRAVPLPSGANGIRVIPRSDRSDLVAITCSSRGLLVLYDDDVGNLVAQVHGTGLQSFGLAVSKRPPGARLFIGSFSDGRIAVIDIPHLHYPHEARIVAYLGRQQHCLTNEGNMLGCGNERGDR